MALDMSKLIGDVSGWTGGVAQATVPVTDLTPHVDGGNAPVTGSNQVAADQAVKVMHVMAGIIFACLALLWLSGALVFRSVRLP